MSQMKVQVVSFPLKQNALDCRQCCFHRSETEYLVPILQVYIY